jgi:hypothetical protein
MKELIYISIILFTLNSCGYYAYPPKVKVSYRYDYSYKSKLFKEWETSKWRKNKIKTNYKKYDQNGNEIEIGIYGEQWSKVVSKDLPDGSAEITSYSGVYPEKLNTVTFKTYNDSNQVLTEEVWRYKDSERDHLVYKIVFNYSENQLVKEIEYDAEEKIIREKKYDLNSYVLFENRRKTIYAPFVRIAGESTDSLRYDKSGRVIEKIHLYNGKFLYREEFRYSDHERMKTELRYSDKPDSLWCITEWRYEIISGQLTRKYWNVINSTTESREEYIYSRKKLLKQVDRFNAEDKTGYTKYKYKLY